MTKKTQAERTSAKPLYRFAATAAVLLAVCLVFMMPVSAAWTADTSWGSNYDSATEFTIADAGDLAQFAVMVNGGKDFSGKTVKLTDDIDLGSQEWTPIGTGAMSQNTPNSPNAFQGVFDGNGKTINGLKIQSTNLMFVGLFGYFSGDVKNLHVAGDITASHSTSLTAGGISGVNTGNIQNCYSSVSVTATISSSSSAQSAVMAGGIAGSHMGGNIQNCYTTGNVKATGGSLAIAGGIVGMNPQGGKITLCYTTGMVDASGTVTSVGGIVGQRGTTPGSNSGGSELQHCYALNAKVSTTGTPTTTYIGRITGNTGTATEVKANYGLKHMTVGSQTVTSSTDTDKNGADICAGAIQSAGWNSNIWDMDGEGNYKLPILKGLSGQPTETPTHIETVTVTFEANGGTPAPAEQTILEGAKVTKPTDLTHANYGVGYTFGWYKDTNGNEAWNFETDSFCKDDTSKTLYAKWTPITYTVRFNANGGTGNIDDQQFTYGTQQALTENSFSKTGYTFAGWATAPDGNKVHDDQAQVSNLASEQGAVVNLYAVWTPITYTVKFNNNTGTGVMADQTFTYDQSQKLNMCTFTKNENTFVGWSLSANEAPVYGDKATVSNLCSEANGVITLYANWTATSQTPTTHKVTFKNGDTVVLEQLVSNGGKATTPNAGLSRIGYTLTGWNKDDGSAWNFDSETVNADTILTANWTANTYTVKFNANGGEGTMADQSFTYDTTQALTANAFTKDGYTFEGWADTEGGSVKYTGGQSVSNLANTENAVVTLYAVWKIGTFTITFEDTGDSTIPAITQTYGTPVVAPTDPVRIGYSFTRWDTPIPEKMPGESLTITAKWQVNKYTVKFDANGGTGHMASQFISYDTSAILTANAFTAPVGKVFGGWNTKSDGSGTAYADKATVKNLASEDGATVTLYAQWKSLSTGGSSSSSKPTYTVTFNANGGVGEMYAQKFTSGKEKALNLNFFTREGYTFAGWATSADGAVVYTDGETIKVTKSMTLYAVWNADTPDVPDTPDTPVVPDTPTTPDKPEQPTEPETPAPILAVFAGLGAAVILRRK